MLSSSEIIIPKLAADGYNWVTYQDHMELTMDVLGLKEHLTSAEMPESYAIAQAIDGLTPAGRWRRDEATAKQYIAASLSESTFTWRRVRAGSSVKDVWDRLQETFGQKHRIGLAVARLERKLFNKRCGDNEDVRSHFKKLLDVREELAGLGKDFTDNEISYILITSLPDSYDDLIGNLEIVAKMTENDLDPFQVMRCISDSYDRRMLRNSESKATQQRSSSTTRRKTRSGY